jgi:uncharacterized phage-associated protein
MSTIFEIADHILANTPYGLTNRELQKLLYLAQGFYLAQTGEALFQEDFQAWKHGPVNSSIFHKYKQYGYHGIERPQAEVLKPIAAQTAAFIVALTLSFHAVGQSKLIEYSHADVPWAAKYIPDRNVHLSKEELRDYFRNFTSFDEYKVIADQKLQFHELIQARLQYLAGLPQIGNAWISGQAAAPTNRTCEVAHGFLTGLERQLFSNQAKPIYPKLIMGPIPTGGVTLELTSRNAMYLHFHNSGRVEMEVEENGHFTEYEVSLDQFEENFAEVYRMMSV